MDVTGTQIKVGHQQLILSHEKQKIETKRWPVAMLSYVMQVGQCRPVWYHTHARASTSLNKLDIGRTYRRAWR
jgi:hypothetical protein